MDHLKWYISRSTFFFCCCLSLILNRNVPRLYSVSPAVLIISSAFFSTSSSSSLSRSFRKLASLFFSTSFLKRALFSSECTFCILSRGLKQEPISLRDVKHQSETEFTSSLSSLERSRSVSCRDWDIFW